MQLRIGLQARPQRQMHAQGVIGVFAGVGADFFHIHLIDADLVHALAAQGLIAQTLASDMALGQRLQPMRAVYFEHIALQHDIVLPAAQRNAVVGQHMRVVFAIGAHFGLGCIF